MRMETVFLITPQIVPVYLKLKESGHGLRKKQNEPVKYISGRGLGMQRIEEQVMHLNGTLKQNFSDEGCELQIETEWKNGED